MKPEIKQEKTLIRVASPDLKGERSVYFALQGIKGISYMMSYAICNYLDIDKNKTASALTQQEISKIEELLKDPKKFGLPSWLLNRRKDYDTGNDLHLITSDLKFRKEMDIKRLQRIKSFRGLRHAWGLPLRGQKTRSNFRTGTAVGVKKKAARIAEAASGKKEDKKEKK